MNIGEQLQKFSRDALELIASEHGAGSFSTAQKLSFLVGLCGVEAVDSSSRRIKSRPQNTFTLVYTDPTTNRSNFQSVCAPSYCDVSPFIYRKTSDDQGVLTNRYGISPFHGIDLGRGFPVRHHATITAASNHYYSRVDPHLREVPTALIVSPRSNCAETCTMCSRAAADTFTRPPKDYVQEHVAAVRADYERRGWDFRDAWSVNITTGSQPSADRELEMMLSLFDEYYRQGFHNVRFHVFSYQITSDVDMGAILRGGAIGYIGTVETFDDARRIAFWGRTKGGRTLASHRDRFDQARALGFSIAEANYVVGTDSYTDMMAGIELLDRHGVAVVPNIMRNYDRDQLMALHPDIWELGFRYVLDGFEAAVATYRHPTIKKYAGSKTVEYLNARGWNLRFEDLPIRHT